MPKRMQRNEVGHHMLSGQFVQIGHTNVRIDLTNISRVPYRPPCRRHGPRNAPQHASPRPPRAPHGASWYPPVRLQSPLTRTGRHRSAAGVSHWAPASLRRATSRSRRAHSDVRCAEPIDFALLRIAESAAFADSRLSCPAGSWAWYPVFTHQQINELEQRCIGEVDLYSWVRRFSRVVRA